jgi:hypothetical protein
VLLSYNHPEFAVVGTIEICDMLTIFELALGAPVTHSEVTFTGATLSKYLLKE